MDQLMQSQSSESVCKIIKLEDQEDSGIEENNQVALAHRETVLSFDHILEQIFGFLDILSLLTCRLVSHRFLKLARRLCKERLCKLFIHHGANYNNGKDARGRTLAQLNTFLEFSASGPNPYLISFPCTCFCFLGAELSNAVLQNFLNINGLNIRGLALRSFAVNVRTHENILMEQLYNILTVQAPNLESLSCWDMRPTVGWQQGIPIQGSDNQFQSRGPCSLLLKTDPEFQQISSRAQSLPRKSNLKILKISGIGVAKTMELLFQLAPKLQEVILENAFFYPQLLEPVKRLHLLKKLVFIPELQAEGQSLYDRYFSFELGTMEKISVDETLQLRELQISFLNGGLPLDECNHEFEHKVIVMINRILEGSKDTLQRLTLTSVTFLWGMKMPTVMSNVREVEIIDFYHRAGNSTVFPKGFPLSETFPKLACVKLTNLTGNCDIHLFYKFLNCLDFGGDENHHALSIWVRRVILKSICFDPTEGFTTIPLFIRERIEKLFPSAEIETKPP